MSQTYEPKSSQSVPPSADAARSPAGPSAWDTATAALRWAQGVGGGGNGLAAMLIGEAESGAEAGEPSDLVALAREWFPSLDTDQDGHLSREELGAGLTREPTPGMIDGDALLAATLLKSRLDFEELSNDEWFDEDDGPTLADLEAVDSGALDEKQRGDLDWTLALTRARMEAAPSRLFADPEGQVDVASTAQGRAGDCSLISAVVSAAAQDPALVSEMISDRGDGTYAVSFPNGEATTVVAPTPAEMAIYASAGADGQWLSVLEKAAGQLRTKGGGTDEAIAQDGVDRTMPAWGGAALMSADGEADFDLLSLSDEDALHEKLAAGAAEGRAMVASIRGAFPGEGERDDRLPRQHAYAILGYDAANREVRVRNPWGRGGLDGAEDPEWTWSLSAFMEGFSTVSIASAAPGMTP